MSHFSGLQLDFTESNCNAVDIHALWTFSFKFYSINWCFNVVVLTTYILVLGHSNILGGYAPQACLALHALGIS